jgi:hypothetical protein
MVPLNFSFANGSANTVIGANRGAGTKDGGGEEMAPRTSVWIR